jgi:hypothetical protein
LTNRESLYAILFEWPGIGFVIPHLQCESDTVVALVRRMAPDAELPWKQTDKGLAIEVPYTWRDAARPDWPAMAVDIPGDHAFCYKVTPIPKWVG